MAHYLHGDGAKQDAQMTRLIGVAHGKLSKRRESERLSD
jgi:hypothetical protein